MVLIADIVSDDGEAAVGEAASHIVQSRQPAMAKALSPSPRKRKKFWLDRSRTAAISRHTNAFKDQRRRGDSAAAPG